MCGDSVVCRKPQPMLLSVKVRVVLPSQLSVGEVKTMTTKCIHETVRTQRKKLLDFNDHHFRWNVVLGAVRFNTMVAVLTAWAIRNHLVCRTIIIPQGLCDTNNQDSDLIGSDFGICYYLHNFLFANGRFHKVTYLLLARGLCQCPYASTACNFAYAGKSDRMKECLTTFFFRSCV